MPIVPRLRAAAIAILLGPAFPVGALAAQSDDAPKRPKLEAGADTNSAQEYYQFGVQQLARRPRVAADAFYWASRLAPPWADPYYARATALVLADRSRLVRYLSGDPSVLRSKEVARIDSLYQAAYGRNPFVASHLDVYIYEELISQLTGGQESRLSRGRSGDVVLDARKASLQRNHAEASRLWAIAIKKYPKAFGYHVERARALAALAAHDSAIAEMSSALNKLRQRDDDQLARAFESVAMFEHAMAHLHMVQGADSLAREGYERALTSDLAFHHAHAALGDLALRQGDAERAAREYAQAVELQPEDAGLRAGNALALIQVNRQAEAVEELKRSVELEPFFAQPYFLLARLLDHNGFTEDALGHYDAFLARAPRELPERQWVQARVTELRGSQP